MTDKTKRIKETVIQNINKIAVECSMVLGEFSYNSYQFIDQDRR
jgi:menaquinone-dependent protoporphyrinogen IX oxidase